MIFAGWKFLSFIAAYMGLHSLIAYIVVPPPAAASSAL